jgi:hypothetical protein
MPSAYVGRYDPEALDASDLRKLNAKFEGGLMFVVYWYGAGSYEGAGHMLFSTDGMRWSDADLGHCSCHGPIEELYGSDARTLQDLEEAYTEEAYRDVKPLFEAIRSHNWERQ